MWTPEKCMVQTRALWRKVEPQRVRQEMWVRDADNSGTLMHQRRGQASPGDRCGEDHTCPSVSFASEKRSELSRKLLCE